MRESSLDFKNSPEKPSDDKKIKLVIVENSDQVVDAARDAADAAMTEQKGKAGLFKRIFKHSLFYDYFRQKEIRKAKNDIQESGNVFAREGGKKEDHDLEMRRIVEQFCDEGDELIHRDAGETKKVLGSEPKEKQIAGQFKQLIYDYAEGKISDQVLEEEKSRIYSELKGVDENLVSKGQLFADNLKEVALQVRQAMEHNEGKAKLDLDLEVIVGKAKSGVRTEAQYNAVDKAVDFVSRHTGSFVNEATLGTAISLIYGTSTKIAQTLARSKAAAVATFGGAALATGAIAGAREHRRLKMERSQIAREQAAGKKYDPEKSPRRKEFEEFKYDVKDANGMFNSLADSIYEHGEDGKLALKEGITQEQFENAIASLSDIESRIKLSNTQKIDLISYSDVTKVGIERQNLDILRARTKKDLRKLLESNPGALKLPEGMTPDDYIRKNIDVKTKNLIYGDKGLEKKDKAFSKMAKHKAFKAGIKAVGVGLVVGAGAQEIAAIFNPDVHGLLEPNEAHAAVNEGSQSVERLTPLESLRRWMMGENIQPPTNAHQELAHNITAPAKLSPHEYLQQHLQSTKHIHRDIWYDNDTPKPVFDKNELKLHWGGEHGTGIDENGNFVYNIKKMMPDGSYHGNFSVDAQQAIAEGKVKLFLSMSRDTQMHPFEVKIDTNGNAIIPKDSELAKVFFENHNGHAKFLGRFAEVGQDFGEKEGIDHLRILATHEGKGLEQIIGAPEPVAPLIPPAPAPLEHEVDLPWIIPMVPRTPLEPSEKEKKQQLSNEKIEEPLLPSGKTEEVILQPNEKNIEPSLWSKELPAYHGSKLESGFEYTGSGSGNESRVEKAKVENAELRIENIVNEFYGNQSTEIDDKISDEKTKNEIEEKIENGAEDKIEKRIEELMGKKDRRSELFLKFYQDKVADHDKKEFVELLNNYSSWFKKNKNAPGAHIDDIWKSTLEKELRRVNPKKRQMTQDVIASFLEVESEAGNSVKKGKTIQWLVTMTKILI